MAEFADWQQRRVDEELRDLRNTISEMVPRREHEQKWKADDYRFEALQEKVDEASSRVETTNAKVDEVSAKVDSLLTRGLGTLITSIVGPILAIVVSHFLK